MPICCHCGASTEREDLCACGESPVLDGRYLLDEQIGQGAWGTTYLARRQSDGHRVCIKELAFHRLASLEAEKFFQREAETLRSLDHPAIPAYIDDFAFGEGRGMGLFLVQEYFEGRQLGEVSKRWTEDDVADVVRQLLEVLRYLQSLHPPVVHRDIKPSNILIADSGQVALVDFGSVKAADASPDGGSSIVGTVGFMAPEQLRGIADERSDIYGVAATALWMLSGRDPVKLMDARHEVDLSSVRVPAALKSFLRRSLEVDPDERPRGAVEALRLLDAPPETVPPPTPDPEPVTRSRPRNPRFARVEEPPRRKDAWTPPQIVLAILVILSLSVPLLELARQDSGEARARAPEMPVVAGLQFGMTPDQVKAAFPNWNWETHQLDGVEIVPGVPMSCTLTFDDANLSRLSCVAHATNFQSHAALDEKVVEFMELKFGDAMGGGMYNSPITYNFAHEWARSAGGVNMRIASFFEDKAGEIESRIVIQQGRALGDDS